MNIDTKTIEDSIYQELCNDATLAEYVKVFSHGGLGIARSRFPFVDLGDLSFRQKQLRAGSCTLIYEVEIFAGTRSIVPGVAFKGNDSGVKGIMQMCEDVKQVVWKNNFSRAFFAPANIINVMPRFIYDKAETTFIGKVSFAAEVWLNHS